MARRGFMFKDVVIRLSTGGTNTIFARSVGPLGVTRIGDFVQPYLFDCRGLLNLHGFGCKDEKEAKRVEKELQEYATYALEASKHIQDHY